MKIIKNQLTPAHFHLTHVPKLVNSRKNALVVQWIMWTNAQKKPGHTTFTSLPWSWTSRIYTYKKITVIINTAFNMTQWFKAQPHCRHRSQDNAPLRGLFHGPTRKDEKTLKRLSQWLPTLHIHPSPCNFLYCIQS